MKPATMPCADDAFPGRDLRGWKLVASGENCPSDPEALAMQCLFTGKPRPASQSSPVAKQAVASERAKTREHQGRDIFRQVWLAEGGVVAIRGSDTREDRDADVADLPLLKAGLTDVDLQELKPFRGFLLGST